MEPVPDVPWVLVGADPRGHFVVMCQACGASGGVGTIDAVEDFADQHAAHQSASPTHGGMGDLVAAITKSLGLSKPCTPCERRRAAMNAAVPEIPFFRRTL